MFSLVDSYQYGCGRISKPDLAIKVYNALGRVLVDKGLSIVSVGTGEGWQESQLINAGFPVKCYDQDGGEIRHQKGVTPIQVANFPADNHWVLPEDCSNVILFSAYPQGFLGALLET